MNYRSEVQRTPRQVEVSIVQRQRATIVAPALSSRSLYGQCLPWPGVHPSAAAVHAHPPLHAPRPPCPVLLAGTPTSG